MGQGEDDAVALGEPVGDVVEALDGEAGVDGARGQRRQAEALDVVAGVGVERLLHRLPQGEAAQRGSARRRWRSIISRFSRMPAWNDRPIIVAAADATGPGINRAASDPSL